MLAETLAPSALDPARSTCAINAGGHALFDKKPAYFAAGALPPYDMELQHRREATGRPIDPSGAEHPRWKESVRDALLARLTHLDTLRRRVRFGAAEARSTRRAVGHPGAHRGNCTGATH